MSPAAAVVRDLGASPLWREIFGNDAAVEIEIGPERGIFLLKAAALRPDHNFFAIERSGSRVARLAASLRERRVANARVIHADAACVVHSCIPAGSVSVYHIYFPDPWWKNRHRHRRLLTPELAADLCRSLRLGGEIHLVTDVEETFARGADSLALVAGLQRLAEAPPRPVRTAFEQKALQRGSRLYAASFRRIA